MEEMNRVLASPQVSAVIPGLLTSLLSPLSTHHKQVFLRDAFMSSLSIACTQTGYLLDSLWFLPVFWIL